MPSPIEKENRSRIRDNQRRSRARRKEYLQELEQRVRQAELGGIHASVEVQAAARQVAEENKKLRQLLRHHGVSDKSVETYLTTGVVTPPGGVNRNGTPPSAFAPSTACRDSATCTSPNPTSPSSTDQNNCAMAADLISTMTGVNPHEVRTSLGCTPGMDCHVDDTKIGNAIEQFTETGVVT